MELPILVKTASGTRFDIRSRLGGHLHGDDPPAQDDCKGNYIRECQPELTTLLEASGLLIFLLGLSRSRGTALQHGT